MANPQKENGYLSISNELYEALAGIRIPGEARQMLDVIIRKTYGFHKKTDAIATSQFKEITHLSNMAIHKARVKLQAMNIITVTQKGNSQILSYSFQKDYDKWKPLPKKVTVTKKGNRLLPKKVTNCYPKGDTQKKERYYTKDNTEPSVVNIIFKHFFTTYKKTFEKDYIANFGKDKALIKKLLKIIPQAEILTLIDRFFESNDKFITGSAYDVGIFYSQINKLRIDKEGKDSKLFGGEK